MLQAYKLCNSKSQKPSKSKRMIGLSPKPIFLPENMIVESVALSSDGIHLVIMVVIEAAVTP